MPRRGPFNEETDRLREEAGRALIAYQQATGHNLWGSLIRVRDEAERIAVNEDIDLRPRPAPEIERHTPGGDAA